MAQYPIHTWSGADVARRFQADAILAGTQNGGTGDVLQEASERAACPRRWITAPSIRSDEANEADEDVVSAGRSAVVRRGW